MDSSKLIFIFFSAILFGIVPVVIHNPRRYYLCLASFLNIFSTGWIFYHYTGLMLSDLPVLCLLFLGAFSGRKFDWKAAPIGVLTLALIVWGIITSFGAMEPGWALAEVSKHFRMYLVMVVIAQNIQNLSDLRLVIVSILSGLIIEAAIGFYQQYFGALGVWFLGERPAARVDWRAMGTFYVAAFYANYITVVVFVAYRMFVYYRPQKTLQSVFYGAAFILGIMALFKSFARAAWIGFLVSLILTSLMSFFRSRYRSYSRYAIPVLVVFLSFFVFRYHQKIIDQFGEGRRKAYESRFTQFGIAERMIAVRPFTGVGLGNYQLNSWDFLTDEEREDYLASVYTWMVHNSYLLYAAELGIIGAVVFVVWFFTIIWSSLRILRAKISHPLIVNVTIGILGGIVAFMILLFASPDIHDYSILYQLGLFSGILLAEWRIIKKAEWQNFCSHKNGNDHRGNKISYRNN